MAGSWEIRQQHHQMILGILHTETTTMAWSLGFRNLQIPGQIIPTTGCPFDHARNDIAKHFLSTPCEYLCYLDSDVIPPPDAYIRLMRHRLPIVSGIYCRRSHPAGVPVMMKPIGQWVTQYPTDKLFEVDVVGAGCLCIHRSVMERMQATPQRKAKRWFDWRVDEKGILPTEQCLSEDFSFCIRAKAEFGYRVMIDPSIMCKHVGLAEAGYGSFGPCVAIP